MSLEAAHVSALSRGQVKVRRILSRLDLECQLASEIVLGGNPVPRLGSGIFLRPVGAANLDAGDLHAVEAHDGSVAPARHFERVLPFIIGEASRAGTRIQPIVAGRLEADGSICQRLAVQCHDARNGGNLGARVAPGNEEETEDEMAHR